MSKFVVDANVAIKWVLPEIHTKAALCQLSGIADTVYLVTGGYVLNLSILGSRLPNQKSE